MSGYEVIFSASNQIEKRTLPLGHFAQMLEGLVRGFTAVGVLRGEGVGRRPKDALLCDLKG